MSADQVTEPAATWDPADWEWGRPGPLLATYLALSMRALLWLTTLAMTLAAGPERWPGAGPFLVATALYSVGLGFYLRRAVGWTPTLRRAQLRVRIGGAVAVDVLLALAAVAGTGGWVSPFYLYGLTTILVPALLYRFAGGLSVAVVYALGYFLVTIALGHDWFGPGRDDRVSEIPTVLNPFIVACFTAYLSTLMRRLEAERDRTASVLARERALRLENEALQREQTGLVAQAERSRIAREIHDGIAQTMFMLSLNLETVAALAGRAPEQAQERLQATIQLAKQALWEVRHYVLDLKPLLAEGGSLADALSSQVREFRTASGVAADFELEGDEPPLPVQLRAGVYRIVQESLANAFKHAKASRLCVRLTYAPDSLGVEIEDDGAGFDPPTVRRGHGLGHLEERARELGGALTLTSSPGHGTTVAVTFPIEPATSTRPPVDATMLTSDLSG